MHGLNLAACLPLVVQQLNPVLIRARVHVRKASPVKVSLSIVSYNFPPCQQIKSVCI